MSCLVVKMTEVRSEVQWETREQRKGKKFYYDKCAALFYGSHYRPTSGRHCESVENNEVEMQFTLVLRQSKLESLLLSQICLLRILISYLTY